MQVRTWCTGLGEQLNIELFGMLPPSKDGQAGEARQPMFFISQLPANAKVGTHRTCLMHVWGRGTANALAVGHRCPFSLLLRLLLLLLLLLLMMMVLLLLLRGLLDTLVRKRNIMLQLLNPRHGLRLHPRNFALALRLHARQLLLMALLGLLQLALITYELLAQHADHLLILCRAWGVTHRPLRGCCCRRGW